MFKMSFRNRNAITTETESISSNITTAIIELELNTFNHNNFFYRKMY